MTDQQITVVDWIEYQDAAEYKDSCGGTGGYFKEGMRGQKDYFDLIKAEDKPYIESLRKEIIENNIRICGDEHQEGCWTPLFSDDTVGCFSFRAWGDLMAAIWSEHEDKDYSYLNFYMAGWSKNE